MAHITTQDYAKKAGVSSVAVTRAMNKNKKLINISRYYKLGRDWVLVERNNVAKINKGKCVVIQK